MIIYLLIIAAIRRSIFIRKCAQLLLLTINFRSETAAIIMYENGFCTAFCKRLFGCAVMGKAYLVLVAIIMHTHYTYYTREYGENYNAVLVDIGANNCDQVNGNNRRRKNILYTCSCCSLTDVYHAIYYYIGTYTRPCGTSIRRRYSRFRHARWSYYSRL